MANQRSPARDKARQMWLDADGKRPLIDIAEACSVSPGLVRKWKAIDHWALDDDQKKSVPDVTNGNASGNGNVPKRKRGGQPGNCNNPKGNPNLPPAPKGNNRNPKGLPLQSNFKTGEYERIVFSSMPEDDKAVAYDSAAMSPAELALRAIALFSVREKRMLDRINERMKLSPVSINGTPMCVSHAVNTKTEGNGDEAKKAQRIEFESLISFVTELEDSLTSVQAKKMSAVESLHRILRDAQMLEIEQRKLKVAEERLKLDRTTAGIVDGDVEVSDDTMTIALSEATEEELQLLLKIAEKVAPPAEPQGGAESG
ncbi:MAG: phage terminase small subunit-related protein [Clostridia bacterium]